MRIDLRNIDNPALHDLLAWLQAEEIDSIVVLGGAVRDTIVGRSLKDIDIAVRLPVSLPNDIRLHRNVRRHQILPSLEGILAPLAVLLGCSVQDFCREGGIPFRNTKVDLLGLVVVEDSAGVCYPDIFVNDDNRVFGAYSELSVNRIAIDRNGNVWPKNNVIHLQNGIGSFSQGPLGINFFTVLRTLLTCKHFHLRLESEATAMITDYLHLLYDSERFCREISDQRIALMADLFDDTSMQVSVEGRQSVLGKIERLVSATSGNDQVHWRT